MSSKNYFEIQKSRKLKLSQLPTVTELIYSSDLDYQSKLIENQTKIEEYQSLLYASRKKSLLIIFQGMDTSGKDGAIKHVMSGVNPQGCSVTSFKTPTLLERDHDFLWRSNLKLPALGQIEIFNRSYFEDVLITKVHPELIGEKTNPDFWLKRYHDISNFESYLHRQKFEIIKIFIHISFTEQKKRLLLRFQDPKKQWKISSSDIRERTYWKEYQKAYEECITETSSKHAPWYIVPGDDKKNARLAISKILAKRLKKLNLCYPELSQAESRKLKKLRTLLKGQ